MDHKSIKITPMEMTRENALRVFQNLNSAAPKHRYKYKFIVGDTVTSSKVRGVFDKRVFLWMKWSQQPNASLTTRPFKGQDYDGELIEGSFYEEELQKI